MLNFHYDNGDVKLYSLGKPSSFVPFNISSFMDTPLFQTHFVKRMPHDFRNRLAVRSCGYQRKIEVGAH
jgi:hypothetical protein